MEKLFFHGVDINEINEALSSPTKGSSKISSPVSSRHGLRPVTKPVLEQKAREDKHFPRFENRSENSSALTDAIIDRKRAEADLQLLINRVSVLRQEEQKRYNKVIETKTRAKEIVEQRKRNNDNHLSKLSCKISQENLTREISKKSNHDRDVMRRRLETSRKSLNETKKAIADETKDEARKLVDLSIQLKIAEEQEKRQKVEEERKRKEEIRMKKEKEKKAREEQALQNYMLRISEENLKKAEADEIIRSLEREERRLLEKINSAQEKQEKAFDILSTTIRSS